MTVSVGDPAPDFVLDTTQEEAFRLSSLRGRKVVLFFYPADESIGCTLQVCALRDAYEDLAGLGAEVVGINGAGVDSHQRFAEHRRLPFQIASDPDDAVRRQYGAFSWHLPGRVTYLVDEAGIVRDVFFSDAPAVCARKACSSVDQGPIRPTAQSGRGSLRTDVTRVSGCVMRAGDPA